MNELIARPFKFKCDETKMNSSISLSGKLLHSYITDRDYYIFTMSDRVVVCNRYMTVVSTTGSMLDEITCSIHEHGSQNSFIFGNYSRYHHSVMSELTVAYKGETEAEGAFSIVRKAKFDSTKYKVVGRKNEGFILKREKVISLL